MQIMTKMTHRRWINTKYMDTDAYLSLLPLGLKWVFACMCGYLLGHVIFEWWIKIYIHHSRKHAITSHLRCGNRLLSNHASEVRALQQALEVLTYSCPAKRIISLHADQKKALKLFTGVDEEESKPIHSNRIAKELAYHASLWVHRRRHKASIADGTKYPDELTLKLSISPRYQLPKVINFCWEKK